MEGLPRAQLFWFLTIPALIFSPLGEEIFFRGFLQQIAEERWNHRTGVIVDAGWFALVHLFHHGVLRIDGQIRILPLSGLIWMALGIALVILGFAVDEPDAIGPMIGSASFPGLIGVAYLIMWRFGTRKE